MECEKLAQEKTEMQRHYVMVRSPQSLFLTFHDSGYFYLVRKKEDLLNVRFIDIYLYLSLNAPLRDLGCTCRDCSSSVLRKRYAIHVYFTRSDLRKVLKVI